MTNFELAVAGNAAAIVTRDADLTVMNPFHNVLSIKPQVFHAQFLHG
jgi:predicted nucleic acid-binding protein